mmetsp:Transcript_17748/g.22838  ORF Transcript_17748/g.22838 Transcript_17748/m.22838 type:complete len:110 (-) Transcript_17748:767-1096(-)
MLPLGVFGNKLVIISRPRLKVVLSTLLWVMAMHHLWHNALVCIPPSIIQSQNFRAVARLTKPFKKFIELLGCDFLFEKNKGLFWMPLIETFQRARYFLKIPYISLFPKL